MRTLKLLVGNSDRRISNLIEVMIRDLSFNRAVIDMIRVSRIDEFVQRGRDENFDLIIFAPDNLLAAPRQNRASRSVPTAIRQIRAVRTHQETPMIAISVSPEQELVFTDAGTDCVLGLPFRFEELKAAVRLYLGLPTETEGAPAQRWTLVGFLMRGLQRLTTLY